VRDVDGRRPRFARQGGNLQAQLLAAVCVEVRERLVEENQPHVGGQRSRERHALLLAAGEFVGISIGQVRDAHALEESFDAPVAHFFRTF